MRIKFNFRLVMATYNFGIVGIIEWLTVISIMVNLYLLML